MRILILSCGTGGGHNDAGRGVAEALEARGHTPVFLDHYLGLAGQNVDSAVCSAYVETVKQFPAVFRGVYSIGRGVSSAMYHAGVKSPVYWANCALAGRLEALLAHEHFDAVVATHLFPAETLTRMKRAGTALPLTVAVATDYTSIPFWEETDCDIYAVPNPESGADFVRRGVPAGKLLPTGIPAPAAFTTDFVRAAVRRSLGFAPNETYILVMGGSMGAGDLPALLHRIRRSMKPGMHLIALTGSNATLYHTLTTAYAADPTVTILDRLKTAAPYMQGCDLLFTKPGGLSSTESVLCRIPTILLDPLSQCETANRDMLVRHGCALAPAGTAARAAWGLRLMQSPAASAAMRRAQTAFLPQNPAGALVDFLEERSR